MQKKSGWCLLAVLTYSFIVKGLRLWHFCLLSAKLEKKDVFWKCVQKLSYSLPDSLCFKCTRNLQSLTNIFVLYNTGNFNKTLSIYRLICVVLMSQSFVMFGSSRAEFRCILGAKLLHCTYVSWNQLKESIQKITLSKQSESFSLNMCLGTHLEQNKKLI